MFKEKADDITWKAEMMPLHVAVTASENVNVQHVLNQRVQHRQN